MTSPVGRQRELTRAREHLSGGIPGSVLFLGSAGIGKSTVLEATAAEAPRLGFEVRRTRATASESDLPFVGLNDLIGDAARDVAGQLPDPLRRALDVVLLRADPPAGGTDVLAVNLAVLEVLQLLAGQRMVLLVLDDVHWLDLPTQQALSFAIRRLPGPRFGVLAAAREADPRTMALLPEPVEVIHVGALTESEIADVVAHCCGRMPSPRRAAMLHRLSAGNPFLAVELARTAAVLPPGVEELPVPDRYRPVLSARLSALSLGGRRTVLASALLSRPTRDVLERIGGRDGLADAEAAGVLRSTGGCVEFDHPLMAAASREATDPGSLTEIHSALAVLADDPNERVRHLALGTAHVDAETASTVETAAHQAANRTAIGTAAELAQHALRLTPEDALDDRVRRAVDAAGWFCQAGESAGAHAVLSPLLETLPVGPLRARCLAGLATSMSMGQEVAGTLPLLREALAQPDLEPAVAIEARMGIAYSLLGGGDLEGARREAARTAGAAETAGLAQSAWIAMLLQAQADLFLGTPLASSPAWSRAARSTAPEITHVYDLPDCTLAWEASWREDQAEAGRLFDGLLREARDRGDLDCEGGLALHRAEVAIRSGNLDEAESLAERGYRMTADGVHDHVPLYVRAHVAAWRGRLPEARQLAATALGIAADAGDAIFQAQCLLVLGFTEVSAGGFEDACSHATELRDLLLRMRWGHPGAYRWQGDAVEAFLANDRVEEAAEVASRLWEQADRLSLPGCQALAARCDGLLHSHSGDRKRALDCLHHSLALMDGLDMPLERARSLLALGICHRRDRQKAAARAALGEAHDIFTRSGAVAWVRRVDEELQRAAGARAGQELTTGERSVAELAAAGQTNREIAGRLYLSPKTVETVLTRVYRKLGVRSRTDLARLRGSGWGKDEGIP